MSAGFQEESTKSSIIGNPKGSPSISRHTPNHFFGHVWKIVICIDCALSPNLGAGGRFIDGASAFGLTLPLRRLSGGPSVGSVACILSTPQSRPPQGFPLRPSDRRCEKVHALTVEFPRRRSFGSSRWRKRSARFRHRGHRLPRARLAAARPPGLRTCKGKRS
jgi:hypothetical protein